MKPVVQSLLIIGSIVVVFVIEQTQYSDYRLQIVGILIVSYFFISYVRRKYPEKKTFLGGSSDIFILITIVLLMIFATGALYSPVFFLLYFLAFGISFIFEPVTVFLFTLGAISLFLPEVLKNRAIESFVRIGSILLISPLAYFFGQQYKVIAQREKSKKERDTIAEKIKTDVKQVKKKQNLNPESIRTLNDILEEIEELENKK